MSGVRSRLVPPVAGVAQTVEQRTCNAKVAGSMPAAGTNTKGMYEMEVGTKLWYVRTDGTKFDHGQEVTVVKVGRVWATLDTGKRISLTTLLADGGDYSSPGRCYTSKEEHDLIRETAIQWKFFRNKIRDFYSAPAGITPDDIDKATKLLKLE